MEKRGSAIVLLILAQEIRDILPVVDCFHYVQGYLSLSYSLVIWCFLKEPMRPMARRMWEFISDQAFMEPEPLYIAATPVSMEI